MWCRTLFSLVDVDEMQKFLTFNFTIFGVDSLRAGVQRSLEPVQLLQLSAKCGEWWKILLHYILPWLASSLCILCNNFNLQLGTILWFHQKHVAWSLATIARIQWCFTLHPSSLSEQIKLWHSMFNFTRGEPQPITGPARAPQLSSLPGRYQYCRDEECQ